MDWKSLIDEVRARGVSYGEIAKACGVPRSTISDIGLRRTKEPKYALATGLLALHKRVMRRKRAA